MIPQLKRFRSRTERKSIDRISDWRWNRERSAQHYTKDNGFGLYDPALEVNLPEITQDKGFNVKKAFEFICFGRAKLVFKKLSKYIETYKNEEFKNGYGEARLVGNSVLINWSNYGGLSGLGFPELWKAFYEEEIGSYDKLLMMSFMLASTGTAKDEDDSDEERRRHQGRPEIK